MPLGSRPSASTPSPSASCPAETGHASSTLAWGPKPACKSWLDVRRRTGLQFSLVYLHFLAGPESTRAHLIGPETRGRCRRASTRCRRASTRLRRFTDRCETACFCCTSCLRYVQDSSHVSVQQPDVQILQNFTLTNLGGTCTEKNTFFPCFPSNYYCLKLLMFRKNFHTHTHTFLDKCKSRWSNSNLNSETSRVNS